MLRTVIAIILIALALLCVSFTAFEFLVARGSMSIWTPDVMGAGAFHGLCMVMASFLLARHKGRNTNKSGGK